MRPVGSMITSVGQPLTAYSSHRRMSLSSSTGWVIPRRDTACPTRSGSCSAVNLGLWMPMTTTSSGKARSTRRKVGITWTQLMQPRVQKSSTTSLPRSSRSDRGREVLSQVAPAEAISGGRMMLMLRVSPSCRCVTITAMPATLVMVVDDEPAALRLIELSLGGAGFRVLPFDDPNEALARLEEGLQPDAIVSDISMPALDGFLFFERVRNIARLRAVPFLFLTAYDERSQFRKGMTLGADDYLTKPFERSELVEAVRSRIERVGQLRHPAGGELRVCGLGHPVIYRDGSRLDWESLKAVELLFYLLEHPDGATSFEVAEALWPGKSDRRASSSFHVTLYRLRKQLGSEIVEAANRRYYLGGELHLSQDVEGYRAQARAVVEEPGPEQAARLIGIYAGDFLTGFDSDWLLDLREELHEEHLSLLQLCADASFESGQVEEAIRIFRAMTEHEPYSEVGWQGLARCLEERGEPDRAQEALERFDRLLS